MTILYTRREFLISSGLINFHVKLRLIDEDEAATHALLMKVSAAVICKAIC